MTETLVSARDIAFLLYEILDVEALCARPTFAEHSRETFDAALSTARQIAEEKFLPHFRLLDEEEPRLENGRVVLPPELGEALKAAAAAGFIAAHFAPERGGMQLPWTVAQACNAHFKAANAPSFSYLLLTIAAANLIDLFGTEAQKARYLEPMLTGRFLGTMVLTEPHAGSSLGDLSTRAEPLGDGGYRITGTKIFISGGEHELSENIVHLVLARIAGAPKGPKGISVFIVPRYRVNADGSLGPANDVKLLGLIHKMGWRGTTSTMLAFGENGDCRGELLSRPNEGLACMFHMMNEARIGVGLNAAMQGYAGYLAALDYAQNRPQGRKPGQKDPNSPPVAIIEHADVKRMLLAQKAYAEGAFALCLYAARLVDEWKSAPEAAAREAAGELLELITPIAKAWPADYALAANHLAIQVHGGYGYTRDFPVEQLYRDNRLNAIHEGTNGIQALDLLHRKVARDGGQTLRKFANSCRAEARAMPSELRPETEGFLAAWDALERAAERITASHRAGAEERALANATLFLDALGRLTVAWLWLRQGRAALSGLGRDASSAEQAFYRGKLQACRYYLRYELPQVLAQSRLLETLDDTALAMKTSWF